SWPCSSRCCTTTRPVFPVAPVTATVLKGVLRTSRVLRMPGGGARGEAPSVRCQLVTAAVGRQRGRRLPPGRPRGADGGGSAGRRRGRPVVDGRTGGRADRRTDSGRGPATRCATTTRRRRTARGRGFGDGLRESGAVDLELAQLRGRP